MSHSQGMNSMSLCRLYLRARKSPTTAIGSFVGSRQGQPVVAHANRLWPVRKLLEGQGRSA
eukprot:12348325-Alexandrium_andersonii.AAC.1